MTDEEKLEAVTAKLTGELYVGQHALLRGREGVIEYLTHGSFDAGRTFVCYVYFKFTNGDTQLASPGEILPL